jgi:hypothetical protein
MAIVTGQDDARRQAIRLKSVTHLLRARVFTWVKGNLIIGHIGQTAALFLPMPQ